MHCGEWHYTIEHQYPMYQSTRGTNQQPLGLLVCVASMLRLSAALIAQMQYQDCHPLSEGQVVAEGYTQQCFFERVCRWFDLFWGIGTPLREGVCNSLFTATPAICFTHGDAPLICLLIQWAAA